MEFHEYPLLSYPELMLAILKVAGRVPADQTAAIKGFDRPVPFRRLKDFNRR